MANSGFDREKQARESLLTFRLTAAIVALLAILILTLAGRYL
jgi:hypothetical protein